MGEGDPVPEVLEGTMNGDAEGNEKAESGVGKGVDGLGDVECMEEDSKEETNFEGAEAVVEADLNEEKALEAKLDEQKAAEARLSDEVADSVEVDEEDGDDTLGLNEENGNRVEARVDKIEGRKEIQEKIKEKEDSKADKGSKKRSKRKTSLKGKNADDEEEKEDSKADKESKKRSKRKTSLKGKEVDVEEEKEVKKAVSKIQEDPKTPALSIERPVRERKSVERLVAIFDNDDFREFHVEKGRGTALSDIPNVAYKISRKKTDDVLKLLHSILFSRREKAAHVKNNILQFSGFVWHGNEEKQKNKVKEKLDKYVKEKLVELCDVLDIPVSKTTIKKEEVIIMLMEFLEAPHATTSELLAEKEQSSKGRKRKRESKVGASASEVTPPIQSPKVHKRSKTASQKREGKKSDAKSESEPDGHDEEEQEDDHEEAVNGLPKESADEISEQAEIEEGKKVSEDVSGEEKGKQKRVSKKTPTKKESGEEFKSKKAESSKIGSPKAKAESSKTVSKGMSGRRISGASPKTSSKKSSEAVKQQPQSSEKSASKETTGKKSDQKKSKPEEKMLNPSDDQLKQAACQILKEVDFNTATFIDILKQLGNQFNMDLTPRKASIKVMVQEELTRIAEEDAE